jgi:hypothetical protein
LSFPSDSQGKSLPLDTSFLCLLSFFIFVFLSFFTVLSLVILPLIILLQCNPADIRDRINMKLYMKDKQVSRTFSPEVYQQAKRRSECKEKIAVILSFEMLLRKIVIQQIVIKQLLREVYKWNDKVKQIIDSEVHEYVYLCYFIFSVFVMFLLCFCYFLFYFVIYE